MSACLLITRPAFESVTYYFAAWSEPILEEARRKQWDVIDLAKEKACRERVAGTLMKRQGRVFAVFNGHGSAQAIAGDRNEVLVALDTAHVLRGKVVYARACASAAELGPAAVRSGAHAFLGYTTDFVFFIENDKVSRPRDDATAALFLAPANEVPLALLKGHRASDANLRSHRKFREQITRLLVEGPTSRFFYTIPSLVDDMLHQVCLGDPDAVV